MNKRFSTLSEYMAENSNAWKNATSKERKEIGDMWKDLTSEQRGAVILSVSADDEGPDLERKYKDEEDFKKIPGKISDKIDVIDIKNVIEDI